MALKNDLLDSERNRYENDNFKKSSFDRPSALQSPDFSDSESKMGRGIKKLLFYGFVAMFGMYIFTSITFDSPGVKEIANNVATDILNSAPNDKLLEDMGAWMERMGYKDLTKEDLIELRKKGVTATFTSKIRELGYNPTMEEMASLVQHDVSSTFASMMHALGYKDISLQELMRLRIHGVTAHYTSNVHDLGYTTISTDDLVRLKDAKVSISMIKKLNTNRVQPASIDELVRYGISNQ